jgi:gamma-glutamylputrescine oxidase
MGLHLDRFQGHHVESWYAATAESDRVYPKLGAEESIEADVCVIGGGLTGLNCALELAERGIDTVLLEGGLIGYGASGRNGGQILHGFACPLSTIERELGRDAARLCWNLSIDGVTRIADQVRRYDIDCDLRWGYVTAAANARQMRGLAASRDALQRQGYGKARLIEGEALREELDSPAYIGGLRDDGCGHLHPLRYTQGLARAAQAQGVRIFEQSRVVRADTARQRIELVCDNGAKIRTQQLVFACNVDVGALSTPLGQRFLPVWSHIIATEPLPVETACRLLPRQAAICDSNHVLNYFRLSSDRRMLFGGRLKRQRNTPAGIAAERSRELARIFPDLAECRIDYSWGGYIDMGLDKAPQFGRLAPRVYYAQGFAGHGVALTGLAGQLIAETIDSGSAGFDLFAQLRPPRIPLHALTAKPLVDIGVACYRLCDRLGV